MMFYSETNQNDIPCPICKTLSFCSQDFPGSYLICKECGWEDDNLQYYDPDYEGGANDVSLNQARENYKLYKISDPRKTEHKPNLPS
jgi:hypothetical protein